MKLFIDWNPFDESLFVQQALYELTKDRTDFVKVLLSEGFTFDFWTRTLELPAATGPGPFCSPLSFETVVDLMASIFEKDSFETSKLGNDDPPLGLTREINDIRQFVEILKTGEIHKNNYPYWIPYVYGRPYYRPKSIQVNELGEHVVTYDDPYSRYGFESYKQFGDKWEFTNPVASQHLRLKEFPDEYCPHGLPVTEWIDYSNKQEFEAYIKRLESRLERRRLGLAPLPADYQRCGCEAYVEPHQFADRPISPNTEVDTAFGVSQDLFPNFQPVEQNNDDMYDADREHSLDNYFQERNDYPFCHSRSSGYGGPDEDVSPLGSAQTTGQWTEHPTEEWIEHASLHGKIYSNQVSNWHETIHSFDGFPSDGEQSVEDEIDGYVEEAQTTGTWTEQTTDELIQHALLHDRISGDQVNVNCQADYPFGNSYTDGEYIDEMDNVDYFDESHTTGARSEHGTEDLMQHALSYSKTCESQHNADHGRPDSCTQLSYTSDDESSQTDVDSYVDEAQTTGLWTEQSVDEFIQHTSLHGRINSEGTVYQQVFDDAHNGSESDESSEQAAGATFAESLASWLSRTDAMAMHGLIDDQIRRFSQPRSYSFYNFRQQDSLLGFPDLRRATSLDQGYIGLDPLDENDDTDKSDIDSAVDKENEQLGIQDPYRVV